MRFGDIEHSTNHISRVSKRTGEILETLGYPKQRVELAKIAGYLHDIGECVNRVDPAHSSAILAYNILKDLNMSYNDRIEIMMAIGNRDKNTSTVVSDISAALILADISDTHKDEVTNKNISIYDRENYEVSNADLIIDKDNKKVKLDLNIDTKICSVLDYFEIFMDRAMMSQKAAQYLNFDFELVINDTKLL